MMKEKTNLKSVAPHKVKGTVLFTVVCVMMVLIVFLMGTLALASTANRRANINFQKEQTETIARTVLTSVATAINNDDSGSETGIKGAVANVGKAAVTMNVTLDGVTYPVQINSVDSHRAVFDDVTGSWVNGNVYEITTRVHTAGDNPLSATEYSLYMVAGTGTKKAEHNSPPSPSNGAFVSLGGVTGKMGTNGTTTGGTQIGLKNTTEDGVSYGFDNNSDQEAPFYVKGNLLVASGNDHNSMFFNNYGDANQKQFMAVTGDFISANPFNLVLLPPESGTDRWPDTKVMDYTEIPCMYVGKTLVTQSSTVKIGDSTGPVNVYCGKVSACVAKLEVTGNVYCFNADGTSVFKASEHAHKLFSWAERTVKNPGGAEEKTSFGSLYSAGNVVFALENGKDMSVGGDLRVAKDLRIGHQDNFDYTTSTETITIHQGGWDDTRNISVVDDATFKATLSGDKETSPLNIGGDLVCGGTLTILGNGKTITINCKNMYVNKLVADSGVKINCTGVANVKDKSASSATITPAPGSADVPTPVYPDGYSKEKITENIVKAPATESYTNNPKIYPTTLKQLNDLVPIFNDEEELDIGSVTAGGSFLKIDSSTKLSGTAEANIYIDASSHKVAVILDDFMIRNNHCIIIDDTNPVYFFVNEGEHVELTNCNLVTVDYLKKILNKSTLDENDIKNFSGGNLNLAADLEINKNVDTEDADHSDDWAYPDVYIYGAKDSSWSLTNNTLITANVRAPLMDFTSSVGIEVGGGKELTYHDSTVDLEFKGKKIAVVGQLIADEISLENGFGLIYVTNGGDVEGEDDDDDEGEAAHGEDIKNLVFTTLYYNFT